MYSTFGRRQRLASRPPAVPHVSRMKHDVDNQPGPCSYDPCFDLVVQSSPRASMLPRRFFRAEGLPFGPGPGEHEPHEPPPGSSPRVKPKPPPKGVLELPMSPQRARARALNGERPEPKSYDPRVSHDGRNMGLGKAGVGAPAFSITSRVKPLKSNLCGPGPAAYGDTINPIKSFGSGSSTLGRFSPRQGGMTGRAVPPRTQLEEKRPGPGGYTPGVGRTGRSLASGGDMPSWHMAGRPSKLRFISKAHSEIDNAGRFGPGPAAYHPRQLTARGEREQTSAYAAALPEEVE